MSIEEDYQAQTAALAASTAAQVAAIYAALQAGDVTTADAALLIAAAVNTANAAGRTLAEVYVTVQVEVATGVPTPSVGLLPRDDGERLVSAAQTILTDLAEQGRRSASDADLPPAPDPVANAGMRLERLARAEPLESGQFAASDAMAAQPLVEGWTRAMDADPCQLCVWWWREGRIWPKAHPFQSHKGCNCQPKIVLAEHIQSTGFTRRLEKALAPSGTRFPR